jgi:phosphomannomutase/phosphoglucomutase
LERLGVRYVTLNADHNGAFPGHDSEPTPENTKDIVELVKAGGFDMGVVHDGDADRTVFIDENGRYLYGDRSLAIVAYHICKMRPGRLVVTNVASSKCVEDAVKMADGSIIFTKVGSPIIARAMMDKGGVFGGEENGGLIFAEFQYCRDGAMAVAKMLEIVAKNGKLSKLNDEIPAYSQYKTKNRWSQDTLGRRLGAHQTLRHRSIVPCILRIEKPCPRKAACGAVCETGREARQRLNTPFLPCIDFHLTAMTSRIILAPRIEVLPLS